MSETVADQGINININNSDTNSGSSGSFLDKIFDIGLKLILPLGLIIGLIAIIIVVRIVLPLIDFVGGIDIPLGGLLFPQVAGLGALFGWLTGR